MSSCRPIEVSAALLLGTRVAQEADRRPHSSAAGYHTCICTLDDKLVVQGGSDGSRSFSSLDVLDLKTKVWHRLDRTLDGEPVSRAFHATVLVGNYLFSTGGHDGRQYAKDILAFDLRASAAPYMSCVRDARALTRSCSILSVRRPQALDKAQGRRQAADARARLPLADACRRPPVRLRRERRQLDPRRHVDHRARDGRCVLP